MQTDIPDFVSSAKAATALPPRSVLTAMARGARRRCPRCGTGALFSAYLKVNAACPACAEELHHQRADDAPPYLTIFFVGHAVVASMLTVDMLYAWPMWLHALVWLPLTIALSLFLLPVFKGAFIGLQWALRMHGFGATEVADQATAPSARFALG